VIDRTAIETFRESVWGFYAANARDLPWRHQLPDGSYDPYPVLVSELMLQQTQVNRVIPKFTEWMQRFPSISSLAAVQLGEVLRLWSGLGYNRRAKYLWEAALAIERRHGGVIPNEERELTALPGIGKNTAGAILAYAYNRPVIFIETNIRTVLFHHFYKNQAGVSDAQLAELMEQVADMDHPREWYWALMDYGAHLKRVRGGLNTLSKHYHKQSEFSGSRRQLRGAVLRALGKQSWSRSELEALMPDERLPAVLDSLQTEGLIRFEGGTYRL